MSKKEPASLADILTQLKQESPLGQQLEQARIWERWAEVAGPAIAAHGRPLTVKDGVLHIEADSSVWMHKFAYLKWHIIGRINRLAGRELVSEVFIHLAEDQNPAESQDGA
jgi:predicted nucleic acid-binding Zn ribbon protein